MRQILNLKKTLKLSFCLISITACQSFPKLSPHLISISDNKCIEYQCSQDACSTICTVKQEWPLSHCDLFTALPPEDVAALKEYQKSVCVQ